MSRSLSLSPDLFLLLSIYGSSPKFSPSSCSPYCTQLDRKGKELRIDETSNGQTTNGQTWNEQTSNEQTSNEKLQNISEILIQRLMDKL